MLHTTTATDPSIRTLEHRGLSAAGLAVLLLAYLPVNFVFGSSNMLAADIGLDLGADAATGQLILAVYTTAFAATLVIAGRLGDRFGRRRLLVSGVIGVVIFAAAAAFAPSAAVLIVLRVGLGLSAGLLTPQVLSTIQTTATAAMRVRGLTMFAAMGGVSTVIGQMAAGLVFSLTTPHLGWRVVQLLTALIAASALIGIRSVPRSRSTAPLAFDALGAALLAAGLLLLVVPLTVGPSAGWPLWCVVAVVGAVIVLSGFWVTQRRAERAGIVPVVPPSVVRTPAVWRGLLMTLLFFVTYGAFLYELTAYARGALGLDTWGAALIVLGFGGAFILTSLALPPILRRVGGWTMVIAGLAQMLLLISIAVLALFGAADELSMQPLLILVGVAQALMYGPVLQVVLSRTPVWAAGVAGGLFTTVQQLGLSLGVAVVGGLFWAVVGAWPNEGSALSAGLSVAFAVHAVCALAFAALAWSIMRAGRASSPADR